MFVPLAAGVYRRRNGTLIARYEGRLLAFVERRLHDRSSSEDVVQETFIGFLNSLPHFDDRRELQTYLFTIASHKLTDHLRRSGRHPLHPASDSPSDILQQQLDRHPAASSLARSVDCQLRRACGKRPCQCEPGARDIQSKAKRCKPVDGLL